MADVPDPFAPSNDPDIPTPTRADLLPHVHGSVRDHLAAGTLDARHAENEWRGARRQWDEGHKRAAARRTEEEAKPSVKEIGLPLVGGEPGGGMPPDVGSEFTGTFGDIKPLNDTTTGTRVPGQVADSATGRPDYGNLSEAQLRQERIARAYQSGQQPDPEDIAEEEAEAERYRRRLAAARERKRLEVEQEFAPRRPFPEGSLGEYLLEATSQNVAEAERLLGISEEGEGQQSRAPSEAQSTSDIPKPSEIGVARQVNSIALQSEQEEQAHSSPMANLRCFWLKIRWQIFEHPRRSLLLAIPATAWATFFTVAGFIQNASGKPLSQWLQDNGLPSLMTLIAISCVIVVVLTAIVAALILLPANSELEAIKPLFEKLTPEQKAVLRWVLPLGRSPINIPQSDKDQLESLYLETPFVTRHTTGHYEVNKDTASRLALLLNCDEVKQKVKEKLSYETARSELTEVSKETEPSRISATAPSTPRTVLDGNVAADKQATTNQWRETIANARTEFEGSGLSLWAILEQKPEFKSLKRHLSTGALQALQHGTGVRASEHPFEILDDEITRIEEIWGLR